MVVFGRTLNELAILHYKPVPSFLEKCFAFLLTNGKDKEGIFRISGDLVELKDLKTKIDATNDVYLSDTTSPYVVANVITNFFRNIPGHVLMDSRADDWMGVNSPADAKSNYSRLPLINRAVLSRLIGFLTVIKKNSDRNKMDSKALSIAISPSLVDKPESKEFRLPIQVIEIMIDNYNQIFGEMPALSPAGDFLSEEDFAKSIENAYMEFFCKSSPVPMKLKPIDEEKQCKLDRNIHINVPNYNDVFQELLSVNSKNSKNSSLQKPIIV